MFEFIRDNRGQAMQIGFILIFGMLMISLAMYQSAIVPDQNKNTEITHSNDMEFTFSELQSTLYSAGITERPTTMNYPMSFRYQERQLTINPIPPAGKLSTSDTENIIISNSSMEHEVPTRYLEYDIDYRLYQDSPVYTSEIGFLYRDFGESQTAISENQFLLNNGFSIVALQGEYQEISYNSIRLNIDRTDSLVLYEITNPEITLPTRLDESRWEDFEERKNNVEIEYDDSEDNKTVTISREGTMELYLTSVSLDGTDGGVNHAEIDLPQKDSGSSDPTTPSDPSGPDDGFEFTSVSVDRDNQGVDFAFEIVAGNSDIEQVTVELYRQDRDGAPDDVDVFTGDPRGFSEEGSFQGGLGNDDAIVVFIGENENGDTIEEEVIRSR